MRRLQDTQKFFSGKAVFCGMDGPVYQPEVWSMDKREV
jgi:hypothetical protein